MKADRLLRLLCDLTQVISIAPTPEEAFALILQSLCAVDGWSMGQVWAPDEDGDLLRCQPVWHQAADGFARIRQASEEVAFPWGMPLLGEVWASPRVRWVDDIGSGASPFRRFEAAAACGLRTALVVPVTADGKVIAILEFLSRKSQPRDGQAEELLMATAAQLGTLITKKHMEMELRHSETLFRTVADTAQDAIITMDTSGVVQYANPQAARMFDPDGKALMGSPVTSIIPQRLQEAHWRGLSRYLSTGEGTLVGRTVVVPAQRSDGTEVPVELSLAAWAVDDCSYFTAILRDVSERHRNQEELERSLTSEREANHKLLELDQLKNTLMDTISHDLRSPLAAIQTVTQVLQRDAYSPVLTEEQRRAYLAGLSASVDKMRRMLDDLLDLERLTSGLIPLQRRGTDLAKVVNAVVCEHGDALRDHSVELDLEPIVAEVDVIKFERVVENLLLNVVRHTPAHTTVTVSLRVVDDGALLCVDDDGAGVPEGMREVIFERFRQVPGHDRLGSGLGLSVVERLAALHGGKAWVQDCAAGGASFRVLLPLRSDDVEA